MVPIPRRAGEGCVIAADKVLVGQIHKLAVAATNEAVLDFGPTDY